MHASKCFILVQTFAAKTEVLVLLMSLFLKKNPGFPSRWSGGDFTGKIGYMDEFLHRPYTA